MPTTINIQARVPAALVNRLNRAASLYGYDSRSQLIEEALEVYCDVLEVEHQRPDPPCSGSGYRHKAHGLCPGYHYDRT